MQGGEAAMVELLGRNLQLTAVFAYNDSMAAGALTARIVVINDHRDIYYLK
jgi:LacI family transcriptional regulator